MAFSLKDQLKNVFFWTCISSFFNHVDVEIMPRMTSVFYRDIWNIAEANWEIFLRNIGRASSIGVYMAQSNTTWALFRYDETDTVN